MIFPGVEIRTTAGANMMLSVVRLEPESVVLDHAHPHEQMGILRGRAPRIHDRRSDPRARPRATSGASPAASSTVSALSITPPSRSTCSTRSGKTTSEVVMPRVVVIGSSNTDMTVRLPAPARAGPDDPGQHVCDDPRRQRGQPGGRGTASRRRGRVCDRRRQRRFRQAIACELYHREGIDVSHVKVVDGVPSGVAMIFVSEDGENMIGVAPGANQQLTPHDIDRPARHRCFARMMCCW